MHGKQYRQYGLDYCKDIIDAIFATSDRGKAEALIDEYSSYWMAVPGTRGATGKKTLNTSTTFANLFDVEEDTSVQLDEDQLEESKLEELEESVDNDIT
jgi:hypothetical protein